MVIEKLLCHPKAKEKMCTSFLLENHLPPRQAFCVNCPCHLTDMAGKTLQNMSNATSADQFLSSAVFLSKPKNANVSSPKLITGDFPLIWLFSPLKDLFFSDLLRVIYASILIYPLHNFSQLWESQLTLSSKPVFYQGLFCTTNIWAAFLTQANVLWALWPLLSL